MRSLMLGLEPLPKGYRTKKKILKQSTQTRFCMNFHLREGRSKHCLDEKQRQ